MRSLTLIALILAGCGTDVDEIQDVQDLRILALRADPPEVLLPTSAIDFDGGDIDLSQLDINVRFDALVVDPRGGEVSFAWQFCPIESFEACRDFEEIRDRSPGYAAELDMMRNIRQSETLVVPSDESFGLDSEPSEQNTSLFEPAPFVVDAPVSLALYHAEESFFGLGSGAWPSAQLRISGNNDSVLATKRFTLGLDDYSAFGDLIRENFDFDICTSGQTSDNGCVELRPRPANTNPVFERLELARSDQADAPFRPIMRAADGSFESPVLVANEEVRIKPVFTDASFETYQELQTNVDTQNVQTLDVTEEISVAWFITGGEVQDVLTWPKFTRTLDTVYSAPTVEEIPESGRVSMWLVAQDQRGGASWLQLDLLVR